MNGNGIYEDEPAAPVRGSPHHELSPGEWLEGIEIVIRPEGRAATKGPVNVAELQARSAREQEQVTVGQLLRLGEIVRLDDPRFSAANGGRGLWERVAFVYEVGAGLYLLEECDPRKTPILFVHGMKGHPREFEALVSNLDRERRPAGSRGGGPKGLPAGLRPHGDPAQPRGLGHPQPGPRPRDPLARSPRTKRGWLAHQCQK